MLSMALECGGSAAAFKSGSCAAALQMTRPIGHLTIVPMSGVLSTAVRTP